MFKAIYVCTLIYPSPFWNLASIAVRVRPKTADFSVSLLPLPIFSRRTARLNLSLIHHWIIWPIGFFNRYSARIIIVRHSWILNRVCVPYWGWSLGGVCSTKTECTDVQDMTTTMYSWCVRTLHHGAYNTFTGPTAAIAVTAEIVILNIGILLCDPQPSWLNAAGLYTTGPLRTEKQHNINRKVCR